MDRVVAERPSSDVDRHPHQIHHPKVIYGRHALLINLAQTQVLTSGR